MLVIQIYDGTSPVHKPVSFELIFHISVNHHIYTQTTTYTPRLMIMISNFVLAYF